MAKEIKFQDTSINDIEPSKIILNTSVVNSSTVKEGSIMIDPNMSVEELLVPEEPVLPSNKPQ